MEETLQHGRMSCEQVGDDLYLCSFYVAVDTGYYFAPVGILHEKTERKRKKKRKGKEKRRSTVG